MAKSRTEAFSLVELVAVLVIAGLVAAAVTLRLEGPLRRATMADLVGELRAFGERSRVLARRHDRPLVVEVDLSAGRLRRTDADLRDELGCALELPSGYRLARMRLPGEETATGRVTLAVSRQGRSVSYALELEGPNGRRTWLLAAGLTGELTVLDGESDEADETLLDTIFESPGSGK